MKKIFIKIENCYTPFYLEKVDLSPLNVIYDKNERKINEIKKQIKEISKYNTPEKVFELHLKGIAYPQIKYTIDNLISELEKLINDPERKVQKKLVLQTYRDFEKDYEFYYFDLKEDWELLHSLKNMLKYYKEFPIKLSSKCKQKLFDNNFYYLKTI
jgi:hypothetical protein